jgi:hypothetical protein
MDPKDFLAFRPLGFTSPPIHVLPAKHSNFAITEPGRKDAPAHPVVFPSRAWVTDITTTQSSRTDSNSRTAQLYFRPCREFGAYFFHLSNLSARLEAEMVKADTDCRTFNFGDGPIEKCSRKVSAEVQEGELAGYSGSGAGVDFGAVDWRIRPLAFASPGKYPPDYPYYVSPVGYFIPEKREQMRAKLGSYDGSVKRTVEPLEGEVMQDLPGAAQGGWFTAGEDYRGGGDQTHFLSLIHDYVDPAEPQIAVGDRVKGLPAGRYSFVPRAEGLVNRDFKNVKPDGSIYCFEGFTGGQSAGKLPLNRASGILLVTLPSASQLRVEYRDAPACGSGPWSLGATAAEFER